MKIIKRLVVLQLLFLFIIPVAFGEISITLPEKELYNLGEKIVPTVSIKEDQAYDGFFSLHIFCYKYDLQYYTIPLNVEADFRTQVTVPELPLAKPMTGKCNLRSNFEAIDGESIDTAQSEDFFVTDELDISTDEDLEAKPGEDILISGEIKKANNEVLSKGEATISFRNEEDKTEIISGKFEHTIHLSDDVEVGDIPILIAVRDNYDNYGDKTLNLKVIPIPKAIENLFENYNLIPGDTLKVRVILYDHNHHAMDGKINVKIFGPDEKLVAENEVQSQNYFEFKTEKRQIPGTYFLLTSFENIKEQNSFTVEEVRKIIMRQEGSLVNIENVGNVEYEDEVTIILEGDDKKYLINKKVDLKPGEKITIDLSKEVPQGTYDIILPEDAVSIDENVIIEDVLISDNRSVPKKITGAMSVVTGAVVSTVGYITSRPILAAIILSLVVIGTVARYSKDFIINKIKGKKEEDASNLFEDYKFEEKK